MELANDLASPLMRLNSKASESPNRPYANHAARSSASRSSDQSSRRYSALGDSYPSHTSHPNAYTQLVQQANLAGHVKSPSRSAVANDPAPTGRNSTRRNSDQSSRSALSDEHPSHPSHPSAYTQLVQQASLAGRVKSPSRSAVANDPAPTGRNSTSRNSDQSSRCRALSDEHPSHPSHPNAYAQPQQASLAGHVKSPSRSIRPAPRSENFQPARRLREQAPPLIHAPTPPAPASPIYPSDDLATVVLQRGQQFIVSYDDTSVSAQGGGATACGLAALNCARIAFGKHNQGILEARLLEDITNKETVREIVSIGQMWTGETQPDLDEIAKLPIFSDFLGCRGINWGKATRSGFDKMLKRLERAPQDPFAMIVTKAPDIITCFRITIQEANVFVIFDPLPRPSHPGASGFIVDVDRERILDYLTELMGVDEDLLNLPDLAWQTEILSTFSEHCYSPKIQVPDLQSLVLRLSIESYAQKHEAERQLKVVQEDRDNLAAQLKPVQEERDKLAAQLKELRTIAKVQLVQARAYRQGVENTRGQGDVQRSVLIQEIQKLRGQVQEKDTNKKLNLELQTLKNSNE
ncbi:hypothetical protein BDN72DRAFT_491769 [Pluteus cervinus]|uniref:Uncharacterized protein n=1 Tax=Pluteus cervinus TaxID=181527 RepID=A0ACD3AZ22_9AGAR|nr:hypothetical protein BDN72DRAFT_491769 [Pluteus cervinus]